jgi:hypothetical protein
MTDQDKGLKLLKDILPTIDERLQEEPLEGQTEENYPTPSAPFELS